MDQSNQDQETKDTKKKTYSEVLQERIEITSEDAIVVDKEVISLGEHLALNYIGMAQKNDGRMIRFKMYKGRPQVHVLIPEKKGKFWHRFELVKATDEEKVLNRKLNIIEK